MWNHEKKKVKLIETVEKWLPGTGVGEIEGLVEGYKLSVIR